MQKNSLETLLDTMKSQLSPIYRISATAIERKLQNQPIDVIEKSILNQGGVEMTRLERNLSWISLCIALSPMLGFFGTVVGMVKAFSAIEIAGTVQPTAMAGNIKIALITTLFGLFTAMILQVCYHFVVNKIDGIVAKMEETSIWIVDYLQEIYN